ncbi:hypothetical protein ACSBR2_032312 [Camellia fascicularis]
MGGDLASSLISSSEEESLLEQEFPELSVGLPPVLGDDGLSTNVEDSGENGVVFGEFDDAGRRISSTSLDFKADQRRRRSVYRDVLDSYDESWPRDLILENLYEAKSKILSYIPGAWIEKVGGMKLSDYDVPNTTSLLLIGPKGSGKSSLVNRISRVFEDDQFASDRAQVSYNSSVGDGTYFLQEYKIPRGSTSFCLFDTRCLSDDSSKNMEMLKHWMTKGVRHGELVVRDSDSSTLKTRMMCKARQSGYYSSEIRMVNFVIFVVNGLSVLKSLDSDDEAEKNYTQLIATSFNCPFLSFKDDKPVVVVTHGDLLSIPERARVRVHLGELLGIPPTTQIFDIPENRDLTTKLVIVDMLCYSLEHADRNLPGKKWFLGKVCAVYLRASLFMLIILGIAIMTAHIRGTGTHHAQMHRASPAHHANTHHAPPPLQAQMHPAPPPQQAQTHRAPPPHQAQKHLAPPPQQAKKHRTPPLSTTMDWHAIRHLWLGSEYD